MFGEKIKVNIEVKEKGIHEKYMEKEYINTRNTWKIVDQGLFLFTAELDKWNYFLCFKMQK